MHRREPLALNGGAKTKTTPCGAGAKHDANAEAIRARMLAGRLLLAMGPSILEPRRQPIAIAAGALADPGRPPRAQRS